MGVFGKDEDKKDVEQPKGDVVEQPVPEEVSKGASEPEPAPHQKEDVEEDVSVPEVEGLDSPEVRAGKKAAPPLTIHQLHNLWQVAGFEKGVTNNNVQVLTNVALKKVFPLLKKRGFIGQDPK